MSHEMHIYHYRGLNGKWIPFGLTPAQGEEWNKFCKRLALLNPKDPNPYFEDYNRFIDNLIKNN